MLRILLSIVLLSLTLYSCGDKNENSSPEQSNELSFDTTDIKTEKVENEKENFFLRYKFVKGKDYRYRVTTISATKQEIKTDTAITQTLNQTITYLFTMNMNSIDADSTMEISCTVKSLKIDADANGQTFTYQSGVTPDSIATKQFAEYEALLNNPFSIRISKTGQLLEVFRVDRISNKYLGFTGLADSVSAEEKNMLRDDIVNGLLKPILFQVVREMPDNNIAKDSVWTLSQAPSQLLTFQVSNKSIYKILNLEKFKDDKLAVIEGTLETEVKGDTKYSEQGVSYVFDKPVTSAGGKIYFNIDSGCVQRSETFTKVVMNYSMEMPGPAGPQKGSRNEVVENTNIVELL